MYAVVRVTATMVGGAWLLCSDGSRRGDLKFFIYLFILILFLGRHRREKKKKGRGALKAVQRFQLGMNVTRKLPPAAIVVATCAPSLRSLRQQQHHTSSKNSRTSKVQEICCFQHEATGNRVFLELK